MKLEAKSVEDYIKNVPEDKSAAIQKLRKVVLENLHDGFEETLSYGMIGYVVPHSIYPGGYHCNPKLPLPFMNIAAQKNFIAVYHSGIYADPDLLEWFTEEFPKHSGKKLDMGKSCIRFKNPEQIPFELIGELAKKMDVQSWIDLYELNIKNNK